MNASTLTIPLSVFEQPAPASAPAITAPAAGEHHEYYGKYTTRVPAGDFHAHLRAQALEVVRVFGTMSEAQAKFAYAPGKWTIKETLGHLSDTERLFGYRALSIGRGDTTPLPGMDQDEWMAGAGFNQRTLQEILAEWAAVRTATIYFAQGLTAEAVARTGTASDRPFSVRALLHVCPGHVTHHMDIVRERYLGAANWPN